jgi:mono/diheme cytochrome c family protein
MLWLAGPALAKSLDDLSHLHGLAFDPSDPQRLLLATHHGLYRAQSDGRVEPVGKRRDDFMALVADPGNPERLYASGHPVGGGNLGLLRTEDSGENWTKRSDGYRGPVDFHQLTVSPADPKLLYGVHGTLQRSQDGGDTWQPAGSPPEKLIALAGSSHSVDRIYAATEHGLRVSLDGGGTWRSAMMFRSPASLVHVGADGTMYAFVLGRGLLTTTEPSLAWKTIYNGFGGHYPLQMAVDHADPQRLAVLTHKGRIFTSEDGGASWQRFGLPVALQTVAIGARIYVEYCAACHGEQGVGETPGSPSAPTDPGKLAPALDGTAHAWHHDDAWLRTTVQDGTLSRGGRMPAWRDVLSEADIDNVLAYVKSLWSARERACQGARHMNCDWQPEG